MPATAPVKFAQSHDVSSQEEPTQVVSSDKEVFELTYDKLVIAVGAYSQSELGCIQPQWPDFLRSLIAFDIAGVKEHAYFLKDVKDSRLIRAKILDCRHSYV